MHAARLFANGSAALLAGMLAAASWNFVASELDGGRELAYGLPVWAVQALMPPASRSWPVRLGANRLPAPAGLACWLRGAGPGDGRLPFAATSTAPALPLLPPCCGCWRLLAGAPMFAALGGLALACSGPKASRWPRCRCPTTRSPSTLAAGPALFTLAGLVFARSGAAARLGRCSPPASAAAPWHGGRGGGAVLVLHRLHRRQRRHHPGPRRAAAAAPADAGVPERRGISLVTSASALGVLLAPSVPLIMYAIIARCPSTPCSSPACCRPW